MKFLKQLIKLHRLLFILTVLFTFLTIMLNLCWNRFLAEMLDILGNSADIGFENGRHVLFTMLPIGTVIILLHTISEFLSSYLASYTCEAFAHEMRMGYAGSFLQSDIQRLEKLNAGEEQSAMQNELKDISDYLNENLFSIMKQFGTFVITVFFLLCQNFKLALISIIPVAPLILYISFSSKIIKNYTGQCQAGRKKINGLADMFLELFPIIQVYDAYKPVKGAIAENLSEWANVYIKKERLSAKLMSFSGVLSFVPLLLLLGFGGTMVINGETSIGIFYIFINLSGNVSGFLQNMPGIFAGFRRFAASVDRLEKRLVWKEG